VPKIPEHARFLLVYALYARFLLIRMRTRVKICGITRPEDGRAAARAGADAIGLVFYQPSPRCVEVPQARAICAELPPLVSVVALFVDASRERVSEVLNALPIDLLQFHGAETAADCEVYGRPYIKAIAMREGIDPVQVMADYPAAKGFLLDAYQPHSFGGGGVAFDWSRVPGHSDRPAILAGGLDPDNVARAVALTRPYAVDVSSGVESAKGVKSGDKIEAFMRGVERGIAGETGG
jgi:phosphoribosylanthranilate isomerase